LAVLHAQRRHSPAGESRPEINTGVSVPRKLSAGSVRSNDHKRLPSAIARPNTRPSTVRTTTRDSPTAGGASISLDTFATQRCSPLSRASATTRPSRVPTVTSVDPTPTPPPIGTFSSACQRRRPVSAASALTRPPVPAA
jgi:hypothetical protein